MKHFFVYLMVCQLSCHGQEAGGKKWRAATTIHAAYAKTLMSPALSECEKIERQTQLNQLGAQLIKDLLNVANPQKIEEELHQWDLLKTDQLNILTPDIDRIIATALTAHELAGVAAHAHAQDAGLRSSSSKVQFYQNGSDAHVIETKYINAKLNYQKICNHLGITHEAIFITGPRKP